MNLDPATREKIDSLIASDRVVLFMKGDRDAPQCGFSQTVVRILDRLVPDYATVDVLADPELRNGIKLYSSWPTIPQLYIAGEFVGGCDIVEELFASGELHESLGLGATPSREPAIEIGDAAAEVLRKAAENAQGRDLHLSIDARFQSALYFGPEEPGEIRVEASGIALVMDPLTAQRADGLRLDAEQTPDGPAFRIENPNAPRVRPITPRELKEKLDSGDAFELLDVRTPEERSKARIEGARMLDPGEQARLRDVGRNTVLVFHCHHGGRAQAAAEHFARLGFENVYNLVGGIDAWSEQIDAGVPRY